MGNGHVNMEKHQNLTIDTINAKRARMPTKKNINCSLCGLSTVSDDTNKKQKQNSQLLVISLYRKTTTANQQINKTVNNL